MSYFFKFISFNLLILIMEKTMKFNINNYVLYKLHNEWHEGRVTNVTTDGIKEVYSIFSFDTFDELILKSDDSLTISTPENRRKLKPHSQNSIIGKIRIPHILKSIMLIDKEWIIYNPTSFPTKHTVSDVLNKAKIFFISNNLSDSDEIIEVISGFIRSFNTLLPKFLLYEKEKHQLSDAIENFADNYGCIYLLRLICFLHKKHHFYVKDTVVAGIIIEYTIYLLDFMLLNYKEFF